MHAITISTLHDDDYPLLSTIPICDQWRCVSEYIKEVG